MGGPFASIGTAALLCLLVVLTGTARRINAYSQPRRPPKHHSAAPTTSIPPAASRRSFLAVLPLVAAPGIPITAVVVAANANALDVDNFIQQQLDTSSCDERTSKKCKPQLSEDEAMCRFGQPSPRTGNACVRAGLATSRQGGVDAFGKIDRGDFVRCKGVYVDDPERKGMLMKQWVCQ